MAGESNSPKNLEVLNYLKAHSIDASKVVVLTGYVEFASTDNKIVRIYPMLNRQVYFGVPAASVISAEHAIPGLHTGPIRVTIDMSTEIDVVQTLKIDDAFLTGNIVSVNLGSAIGDRAVGNDITTTIKDAHSVCIGDVPRLQPLGQC